ncbi:MAG TPA: hypothetical protein VL614_00375 [Acetobacteraceae bacterium]|jgi:hypothetical protein|nr:hypothetical protein [Acetobacteraceae bacterium]
MSGSTVVIVDVAPQQPPLSVVEVEIDDAAIDVTLPPPPLVSVELPPPQPPLSVDVVAPVPPVVTVDASLPPPPNVDVTLPDPVTVDVDATPQPPVQVDVLAAWQGGIPDAPIDGTLYGRLNQHWVGVPGGEDLVTSVARKIGDVLLYTDDLEDWDSKVLDGGNF